MIENTLARPTSMQRLQGYIRLTKPRVVSLIVFCAIIGMFLSTPGMVPLSILVAATVGIALVAGAAAAVNCLIERKIDSVMARTRRRPLPQGQLNETEALLFSLVLGGLGLTLLLVFVNPLTAWLTLATFIGYAVIYTVILKPRTPQNIVIGGASGAMPPVLGWAAVTGQMPEQAWLLFLIIFVWTPPHFWSLALYRVKEYEAANLPMLPVVHGRLYTRRCVFAYTLGLVPVTLMPFFIGMSGWLYLAAVIPLNAVFITYGWQIWRNYSDRLAQKTFRFSIAYLSLLFAALLADHNLFA